MDLRSTWVTKEITDRYEAAGLWTQGTWVDDLLAWHRDRPDAPAVVDDSGRVRSVDEVVTTARRLAGWLWANGVGPGDVVGIMLPNWSEFVVAHAAVGLVGGVVNPISVHLGRAEVHHMLRVAGAAVVITATDHRGHDLLELLDGAVEGLASRPIVVTVRSDRGTSLESVLAEPWEDRSDLPATPPVDPRAIDTVLFTSGTESAPKGAVHTHQTARFDLLRYVDDVLGLGPDDAIFMPSPICHATGLQWGLRASIRCRSLLVLQDRWDPDRAVDLVEAHGCTYTLVATPFVAELLEAATRRGTRLDTLRHVVSGGAPIPRQLIDEVGARLAGELLCVFGATETYVTTATRPSDGPEVRASDGRALPGVEVAVVDADGVPVGVDVEGEIVTRGPHVFAGYLGDEELTTRAFRGEWYRFGDLGRLDEHGALRVTGRIKDIVIRGGQNISVREVEEELSRHPQVADVVIVGYPDARLGERCCAFVVPVPDAAPPGLDDLCTFLLDRGIARYKLPERIELIGMLPKTASGKYRRVELRALVEAGRG